MPNIFRKPGVYIHKIGATNKTIVGVATSTAVLIGTFPKGRQYMPTNIRSLPEFERTYAGLKTNNLSSLVAKQFFENGGQDLWIISTGARLSGIATPLIKGLSLLSQIPSFNILVIPETNFLPNGEATKIFQTAVPLIEKHQAMYVLDPPQENVRHQTVKDLAAWVRAQPGIQRPNVILYYLRVQVRSQNTSVPTTIIPNSSTIAGILARTDVTRGVWKAPAGNEARLRGIVGLEGRLTSRDITNLTSANINALKQMTSSTYVVWGSRTLSSDPESKYVPVRRTALFLETSIEQGTAWAVFKPNNEPLWAQIRQAIETFMHSLFRQGAFLR